VGTVVVGQGDWTDSGWARVVNWAVAAMAGAGVLTCAVATVDVVGTGHPIGGVDQVGRFFPVLFACQVWVVLFLRSRTGGGRMAELRRVFTGLPTLVRCVMLAMVVVALVVLATTFDAVPHGVPGRTNDPACPFVLNNHGDRSCISAAEYLRAAVGEQRLILGVSFTLLTGQTCAAVAGAMAGRRSAARTSAG
jgi:hypothetical protein